MITPAPSGLPSSYQSFIHLSKYARWLEDKGRKETWPETVDRYLTFMRGHLASKCSYEVPVELEQELRAAIVELQVMPSMRALMSAGPALGLCNMAAYNCSYLPIIDARCFDEILYILMCGTGVGYSVERKYVELLPAVPAAFGPGPRVVVQDSRAGWAEALRAVVAALYAGQVPTWDVSLVRAAGAPLKTFGGRASGPQPLVELFCFLVDVFQGAAGRRLSTLECHDVVCKTASIVVSGGVRRSALICLSSVDDDLMRTCKSGAWWEKAPHRALANVSACYESVPDATTFAREWQALYDSQSGERGIFCRSAVYKHSKALGRRGDPERFRDHYGCNPCSEVVLRPFELCNLTEVVCRAADTPSSLLRKVRMATILGTFQSTLDHFEYVRRDWCSNQAEERLLGVSMTGIMDNKLTSGYLGMAELEQLLQSMRQEAIATNDEFAAALNINPSAAITAVKPSGTVSQLVDSASGIHPRYAQHYIRRVRGNNHDPVTQFLAKHGVPAEPCVLNPATTTVFSFPMRSPSNAIVRDQLSALEHLELCKAYQKHFTMHKVSVTVSLREGEWDAVRDYVLGSFEELSGVSFLPYDCGTYKQMPYEAIDEPAYKQLCRRMPQHVPWAELAALYQEGPKATVLACSAGGGCEAVDIVG